MEHKSVSVAYLMWLLLGPLGGHRFYLGQIGWGLFFLCTFGCFVIGWLIDFFMIPSYVRSFNRRVDFLREEEHLVAHWERGSPDPPRRTGSQEVG